VTFAITIIPRICSLSAKSARSNLLVLVDQILADVEHHKPDSYVPRSRSPLRRCLLFSRREDEYLRQNYVLYMVHSPGLWAQQLDPLGRSI